MRTASIATGVSLTHIGDCGFGVRSLDLEGRDESVLGFERCLVRLVSDPDADGIS
jgi:hypothetical protein